MTDEQKDAIYAAYLGICVLQTMCRKTELDLGQQRCKELLVDLGTAFPFIAKRVALSTLRSPALTSERCDGADDLEHLDGMLDDRERG